MDFGYPQFTEAKILSEFIKTDAHKMEVTTAGLATRWRRTHQLIPSVAQVAMKPPMAVTNAVSWRSEGIKHKKNEVFLDVVESVNLLVNSNGTVVLSEVVGCLKMRTFLSGMPECKLGLNDKVRRAWASAGAVWVAGGATTLEAGGGGGTVTAAEDTRGSSAHALLRCFAKQLLKPLTPGSHLLQHCIVTIQIERETAMAVQTPLHAARRDSDSLLLHRAAHAAALPAAPPAPFARHPHIMPHAPCATGSARRPRPPCTHHACAYVTPGALAQVLFETQGRSNRQKAVDLEDIKFHQCVRLARFESDRTISFVPPDGAFDLMSYRLSQNIK
jgi:hypothetical protein